MLVWGPDYSGNFVFSTLEFMICWSVFKVLVSQCVMMLQQSKFTHICTQQFIKCGNESKMSHGVSGSGDGEYKNYCFLGHEDGSIRYL